MGITNINKVLIDFCTNYTYGKYSDISNDSKTGYYISKSELSGKIIAIDMNNIIYDIINNNLHSNIKLKNIEVNIYQDIQNFLMYLKSVNIIPILVFDNKENIYELRKLKKFKYIQNDKQKLDNLKIYNNYVDKIDNFLNNNVFNECILNILNYGNLINHYEIAKEYKSEYQKNCYLYHNLRTYVQKDLIKKDNIIEISRNKLEKKLRQALEKYKIIIDHDFRSIFSFEKIKSFLDKNNIKYIESSMEAEEYISKLVREKIADYGLSNDSDLFMYLCPNILRKMDYFDINLKCQYFEINKVINGLKLNKDLFIDLCIALGTDYSENINMNYIKMYKYISIYGTPTKWPDYVNIKNMNYEYILNIIKDKLNIVLPKENYYLFSDVGFKNLLNETDNKFVYNNIQKKYIFFNN
jgi:hypothetical protein